MLSCLKRGKDFYKMLISLAVPIILQNLINASLGLCDTFMLGVLGETEIAAVTIANTPFSVINMFTFGFCSGGSVLISQYWGKRDTKTISRVIGVSYMVGFCVTVLFASITIIFPEQIVHFYTKDPALIEPACTYMKIVAAAHILNVFPLVYVTANRSLENPKLGTYIFSISMLINTFLNWIIIFGNFGAPALGVKGAAIATVISRVVENIIAFSHIAFSKRFRINFKLFFRPGKIITKDFFHYGTPIVFNEGLWGLGVALFPAIYGNISTSMIAATTVSSNIERILQCFIFGLANTSAVIVGKHLGAGGKDTAYELGKALNILSLIVGVVIGIGMIAFIPFVPFVFNLAEDTLKISYTAIFIFALINPLKCYNFTNVVGVLRAGGDVKAGLILDTGCLWVIAIPLTAIAGLVFKLDPLYVFLCVISEDLVKAGLGEMRFRQKKWINNITKEIA